MQKVEGSSPFIRSLRSPRKRGGFRFQGQPPPSSSGRKVGRLTEARKTARVRCDLPTGTVSFLFTDVEGSTKLLRELGAAGTTEHWLRTAWCCATLF